jgi:hypothetical protein
MMRSSADIIEDVRNLQGMHRVGLLGGAVMPEDVHPKLDPTSADLCHYFTLPMALNYQRDSYKLWPAATAAFHDPETRMMFDPVAVANMDAAQLWPLLAKHKVGLQSTRHTQIWHRLCTTLATDFGGDVRNLFRTCDFDIAKILAYVGDTHRAQFPYLGGPKISNYWLYVMGAYTRLPFTNRAALSIAPDTHVMQASLHLGVIADMSVPSVEVAERWRDVLRGTDIAPIDVHTPLWLWSRAGFPAIIKAEQGVAA